MIFITSRTVLASGSGVDISISLTCARPTKLISPVNTFQSCGSSSSFTLRKKPTNGVIDGVRSINSHSSKLH